MTELDLYQRLAERHGHYCPMSTLGVRLGEAALQQLTLVPASAMQLSYLLQTCAADGIRMVFETAAVPCELLVEPLGEHRLRCRFTNDQELSLQLSAEALQLAAGYRALDEAEKPARLELLRSLASDRLIDVHKGLRV